MTLQGLQQLCGFNTLMYFSATIFDALGMSNGTATGLLIAAVNFIFTLVSLKVGPSSAAGRRFKLTSDRGSARPKTNDAADVADHDALPPPRRV